MARMRGAENFALCLGRLRKADGDHEVSGARYTAEHAIAVA